MIAPFPMSFLRSFVMVFLFCPSYWIVGTGYSLELHRTNGVEYSGTACYHSQPFKWALAGFGSIICFGHEKKPKRLQVY